MTLVAAALCLWLATSCGREDNSPSPDGDGDTLAVLSMQIQQCSRLYTTEYKVHRILARDDALRLKGSFMDYDFDLPLPLGDRKVVVPIDATLKGYIDFSEFSVSDVHRRGDDIEIVLPDPRVVLTSTRVDANRTKEYVGLVRAHFSDRELSEIEAEGRRSIIESIPRLGIVESARQSAVRLIIPLMAQMGFDEKNITVTFRDGFNPADIDVLMSGVEKKERRER